MGVFVILLRAIGPVTHKIMSMAQWRDAAAGAGFTAPETYVATGNMIVESELGQAEVTRRMDGIVSTLGLGANNKAIVRSERQLSTLLRASPFARAAAERPQAVAIHCFAKAQPDFSWVADYAGPEIIHIEGTHLIVDYDSRQTTSRLPVIIEKRSGVATARNWNTLRGLVERAAARKNKDH